MTNKNTPGLDAIKQLESILCGPDGTCCIAGSLWDRNTVDEALAALRSQLATTAPAEPMTKPADIAAMEITSKLDDLLDAYRDETVRVAVNGNHKYRSPTDIRKEIDELVPALTTLATIAPQPASAPVVIGDAAEVREYPELPEPFQKDIFCNPQFSYRFTVDQMQAYVDADRAASKAKPADGPAGVVFEGMSNVADPIVNAIAERLCYTRREVQRCMQAIDEVRAAYVTPAPTDVPMDEVARLLLGSMAYQLGQPAPALSLVTDAELVALAKSVGLQPRTTGKTTQFGMDYELCGEDLRAFLVASRALPGALGAAASNPCQHDPFPKVHCFACPEKPDANCDRDCLSVMAAPVAKAEAVPATPAGDEAQGDAEPLDHFERGLIAARKGIQELFVDENRAAAIAVWEGDKPIARFVWYEDGGDASVGEPGRAYWALAEDQTGTELADLLGRVQS